MMLLESLTRYAFPLGQGISKVMFLYDGTYKKGMMEWDLDNSTWRFSQIHCKGTELFGLSLPEFCQTFQKYIDDGTIVCGWYGGMNFHLAGSTRHVSAVP